MNRNITAVIAAGLMLLAGCSATTAGTAVSVAPPAAPSGFDLGSLWDSITDPCPLGQRTRDPVDSTKPDNVPDEDWPDESEIRSQVAAVHTPSSDAVAVTNEVKQIKLDLFWTWREIQEDATALRSDPGNPTRLRDMSEVHDQLEDEVKAHLRDLETGNFADTTKDFDDSAAAEICTG